MTTSTRAGDKRTCLECEYFDGVFDDCLSRRSDRFQTRADSRACYAFHENTTLSAYIAAINAVVPE